MQLDSVAWLLAHPEDRSSYDLHSLSSKCMFSVEGVAEQYLLDSTALCVLSSEIDYDLHQSTPVTSMRDRSIDCLVGLVTSENVHQFDCR